MESEHKEEDQTLLLVAQVPKVSRRHAIIITGACIAAMIMFSVLLGFTGYHSSTGVHPSKLMPGFTFISGAFGIIISVFGIIGTNYVGSKRTKLTFPSLFVLFAAWIQIMIGAVVAMWTEAWSDGNDSASEFICGLLTSGVWIIAVSLMLPRRRELRKIPELADNISVQPADKPRTHEEALEYIERHTTKKDIRYWVTRVSCVLCIVTIIFASINRSGIITQDGESIYTTQGQLGTTLAGCLVGVIMCFFSIWKNRKSILFVLLGFMVLFLFGCSIGFWVFFLTVDNLTMPFIFWLELGAECITAVYFSLFVLKVRPKQTKTGLVSPILDEFEI